jgi:hypothetical protein
METDGQVFDKRSKIHKKPTQDLINTVIPHFLGLFVKKKNQGNSSNKQTNEIIVFFITSMVVHNASHKKQYHKLLVREQM